MRKTLLLSFLIVLPVIFGGTAFAANSETVSFTSGTQTLTTSTGTPLSAGTSNDGDGFVLELGYYSTATSGSVFSGSFVALSGQGSLNTAPVIGSSPSETFAQTSIGDTNAEANGDGTFALSLTFTVGSSTSGNSLPLAGIPLAIRFYNATSIGSATQMNAVSDASWVWLAPSNPTASVTISLNDAGLQWLRGSSSAFKTQSLAVPTAPAWLLFGVEMPLLLLVTARSLTHRKS